MTEIPEHLLKRRDDAWLGQAEQLGLDAVPEHLRGRIGELITEKQRRESEATRDEAASAAGSAVINFATFRTSLNAAIEERKSRYSDDPHTRLVLESFEGSLVVGAAVHRFADEADGFELTGEYIDVIPRRVYDGLDDFSFRRLGGRERVKTQRTDSLYAGALAMTRAWVVLQDVDAVKKAVPKNLTRNLTGAAQRAVGFGGILSASKSPEGLAAVLQDTSHKLSVPNVYAQAIDSFGALLNAPEGSVDWPLNHFERGASAASMYARGSRDMIYEPRSYVAGARLVASKMQ